MRDHYMYLVIMKSDTDRTLKNAVRNYCCFHIGILELKDGIKHSFKVGMLSSELKP